MAILVHGTAGDDTLTGTNGTPSADTMLGGAGNDSYIVDHLGDMVFEYAGEGEADAVVSSVNYVLDDFIENLTLMAKAVVGVGNELDNVIEGNALNNTLDGGAGADVLVGGIGNDTYIVDDTQDEVVEAANEGKDLVLASVSFVLGADIEKLTLTGTDSIDGTGNGLNNVIIGNSGDNVLDGKGGNDILAGSLGDDTYVVDSIGDKVTEATNAGKDTVESLISYALSANLENLTLIGNADINGTGNAISNLIAGNKGDNILNGLGGADTLIGGKGDDTYVIDNAGDKITEDAGEGTDTLKTIFTASLAGDYASIENLVLLGRALNGTGNDDDNSIIGNGMANNLVGGLGNDTLDGGKGVDTLVGGEGDDVYYINSLMDVITENAGEGTDTLVSSVSVDLTKFGNGASIENLFLSGSALLGTGNASANFIIGNTASNTLDGGAGADTLAGGQGNDTYIVDDLGDIVVEKAGGGMDTVKSSVTYTLTANVEKLTLTGTDGIDGTGNALNNVLIGNAADNILDGGAGNDSLAGGLGNDTYVVDSIGDKAIEATNAGTDLVQSWISYVLGANLENLTLTGTANINGTGNALSNVIIGNEGMNILIGGDGKDTISGGFGDDSITGGSGKDQFVFDLGLGFGGDLVLDFEGHADSLLFSGVTDVDGNGFIDVSDLNFEVASIVDQGKNSDVVVSFASGDSITFAGVGTGAIAQITDLVKDLSQIQFD